MWPKPAVLYDRESEWEALSGFAADAGAGAALALVYGRRRQGKTLLLELLSESAGGLVGAGLEQSSAQNLAAMGEAYARRQGMGAPIAFAGWTAAIEALLALGEATEKPVPLVLDEFPYLVATAPELPSVIQRALSPRSRAMRRSRTRLVLCGSAFSVMQGLLGGTAPLRGRATTELLVNPFDYRTAAGFWEVVGEWDVAIRLHALIGGTPAYRGYASGRRPASVGQLGRWVTGHLLNPASAFFREGRVLLAEEGAVGDAALYLSVLAALAGGATRRGQIAAALGRKETALAHPLRTLEDTRLITRVVNPLHERRSTYRIAEPILRSHQLLIGPHEGRLARGQAQAVWDGAQATVESNIYGPHLEDLAREWAAYHAAPSTLGGSARAVGSSDVACREHRGHQVDVVVAEGDRIIALGEAKWRSVGADDLDRLRHIRSLVPHAAGAQLLLFSGAAPSLRAAQPPEVQIIDLERLYTGD